MEGRRCRKKVNKERGNGCSARKITEAQKIQEMENKNTCNQEYKRCMRIQDVLKFLFILLSKRFAKNVEKVEIVKQKV